MEPTEPLPVDLRNLILHHTFPFRWEVAYDPTNYRFSICLMLEGPSFRFHFSWVFHFPPSQLVALAAGIEKTESIDMQKCFPCTLKIDSSGIYLAFKTQAIMDDSFSLLASHPQYHAFKRAIFQKIKDLAH